MKSVDFRNDPMFLRNQFARDGTFEMPVIKKTKLDLDNIELIVVDYAKTNNLTHEKTFTKPIIKYIYSFIEKGGGAAGGGGGTSLPIKGKPNSKRSLFKDGKLIQERIYDENGQAKTDVDYTDHGNSTRHPECPMNITEIGQTLIIQ